MYNPLDNNLDSIFLDELKLGYGSSIEVLLMNNIGLETISSKALRPLRNLKRLELSQNQLRVYAKDSLSGLPALEQLSTDEPKLCCSYFHVESTALAASNCRAPRDELSSCDDLLAQDFFRVALWLIACLAVVGNVGVLAFRQLSSKDKASSPSALLVKNLCAADLLMGVYLLMIGAADARLKGDYVARDSEWRASASCAAAGFLSFLSSEVSAFTMCLITLDRVLVICFPFLRSVHLTVRSARLLCLAVWAAGAALSSVPLLAATQSYGQNGICVPLPITRKDGAKLDYTFFIFILLNFVLFVLIGAGQVMIYAAVRRTGKVAGSQNQERDAAVARSLFLVALTDFLCWFPIGLMGVLAAAGVPIPGVVYVWSAVFVLPLNSALNPFLYTLNGVLEKRRAAREARGRDLTLARLTRDVARWPEDSARGLLRLALARVMKDEGQLPEDSARLMQVALSRTNPTEGSAGDTAVSPIVTPQSSMSSADDFSALCKK